LTNKEKEKVRCLISKVANIPPDDVRVLSSATKVSKTTLYVIDNYMGYNFVLGFETVPTLAKISADLKDLYLTGSEWDWDEDHPI